MLLFHVVELVLLPVVALLPPELSMAYIPVAVEWRVSTKYLDRFRG